MSSHHIATLTLSQQQAVIKALGRMVQLRDADEQLVGAFEAIVNAKEQPVDPYAPLTLGEAMAKLRRLQDDELGMIYRAYSGRGMMGCSCLAFSTSCPDDVIARAGITGARRDTLGRDHIVYWPSIRDEG